MRDNSNALPLKGVIKVTIQYRMGLFGHFAHPEMGAVNVGRYTSNWFLLVIYGGDSHRLLAILVELLVIYG